MGHHQKRLAAPANWHESVRQTCSLYLPTGLREYIV